MGMLLLRMLLLMMVMVMVMVMTPQGVQAQSTCTAVTEIKSRITYITCHFQEDASKYDFNVKFFPSDGSTQETALACNHHKYEERNCHKASGVEFDEHQKIRYYFTFARNASLSPAGSEYLCQKVPSEGGDTAERCKVGEIEFPEVPQPISPPADTPPADTPPADTPPADTDGSGESPAVIILLLIIMVIVVAFGICGALAYVKRDRITSWWTMHTIGIARTEENMDPEKNTSQNSSATRAEFPKIPQGWPAYFYNMGWKDGAKGETMPIEEGTFTSYVEEPNLGDRGAAAPLLKEMRAGPIRASIQESREGETYHDAQENPVSPGPATKYMNKLQAEQKKAEKERVKRAKEAAEQRAKEIILTAESEAKRITDGAKGKSKEEIKKAKLEADRILKKGREGAKHMKEGTGKGDNEGNQDTHCYCVNR